MTTEHRPAGEAQWLTPDELRTWRALCMLVARLPAALGSQLQCTSGLSFLEYYALAGLSESPGRRMRMNELAVLTNAEQSRLSHLVARLEKRGFVHREPDPADGRFTHAVLSEAGYAHLVDAAPDHVDTVRQLVFDPLTAEEQQALERAAVKVVRELDGADASG